jgi:hypothetical protein
MNRYSIYSSKNLAFAVIRQYPIYKQAIFQYSDTIKVVDKLIKVCYRLEKYDWLDDQIEKNIIKFSLDLPDILLFYFWRKLYFLPNWQSILDDLWFNNGNLKQRILIARNAKYVKIGFFKNKLAKNQYDQDILPNVCSLNSERKKI